MQFWQQQLMYKQLQELQRQQQLQQLNQGGRQQNALNPLSAVIKPVAGNQLPGMMNDIGMNDASNYMWQNNFFGSLPPVAGSPQMQLVAGNMNWVQSPTIQNVSNGLILSNDESHAMRSLDMSNQQLDQTLSDVPALSSKGSMHQYTHFSGLSNDSNNLVSKSTVNHAEKALDPANSFQNSQHFPTQGSFQGRMPMVTQNFQGKGLLGNASSESNFISGNFQQEHNMDHSNQTQEANGRQEEANWLANLQERPQEQVGTPGGVTSLDPTEQKILFGSADDDNWGASFTGNLNASTGGYLNGLPVGNDFLGGFPSINSGSWSALMQEAVQASSSDKGIQEEWSGLDFQKIETSMVKHSILPSESGQQLADWNDDNLQHGSSTSKPLPLFNDSDTSRNSSMAPNLQSSFGSPLEESSGLHTNAPHASFQFSSNDTKIQQFHQAQKHKELQEGSLQTQTPETNGTWAGQAYMHQVNSSGMQSTQGGWIHQKNMPMANNARQPSSNSQDWAPSYPVEPGRVSNANVPHNDSNNWRLGGSHVVPNGGVQPFEPHKAKSQGQHEDSFIGNNKEHILFGKNFAVNSSINSGGNENVAKNQNWPSGRPPVWEPPMKNFGDRSSSRFDQSKGQLEIVPGDKYVSNNSNLGQRPNIGDGAKESPTFTGYDQNPSSGGNQKSLSGQQTFAPSFFQDQMPTLRMNVEPSFPRNQLAQVQGRPDSFSQGFKSEEQIYVGKPNFNVHNSDNHANTVKGFLIGLNESQSRDLVPINANSPGESSAHYTDNKNDAQTSNQNMLELLHKVDLPRNSSTMAAPGMATQANLNSASHSNQPHAMQGFGLRLAPPSHRQQLPLFASPSQTLHDGKSEQLDQEAGNKDKGWSISKSEIKSYSSNEASHRENLSNISGEKHHDRSDISQQVNSLSASSSDYLYAGHQQQHIHSGRNQMPSQQLREHFSGSFGHEALNQSVNSVGIDQTNMISLGKSDSVIRQSCHSHDTSKCTPPGDVPTLKAFSFADTPASFSSKSSTLDTENGSRLVANFPQVPNSDSFNETRHTPRPSTPGMSQQVGISNMLHNVWTNISAQQRLAGFQPHKVTPQILQSIINNSRSMSLWGMKEQDQGKKVEQTSENAANYSNSQNYDCPRKGNSLSLNNPEKVDSANKADAGSQGPERPWKTPSDGGSNLFVPSLSRFHQQDADKEKGRHDPDFQSQAIPAPNTSFASSSYEVGCSGSISVPLDVQQQNYSLLHQMQAMKGADLDPSKILGQRLKAAFFGSNSSQIDWNEEQRVTHGKNTGTSVQADGSLSAEAKMLSFVPKGDREKNISTPYTVGRHDLQDQTHALSTHSAANSGGIDRTKISPQMAPSWFEKYGAYQNGSIVAGRFDSQLNAKTLNHPYFLPKIPRTTEYPGSVDQRNDNSQTSTHQQSTLPVTITGLESPSGSMLPGGQDHGMILRTNKRKSVALELVPWHKVVGQGRQKLRSISMAELDWSQATNRLFEKVNDEAETLEDVPSRRRLILSTQLMQELLPAVPARLLKAGALSAYDSVTFYVSKSVLADACSLISSSGRIYNANSEDKKLTSEKLRPSEVKGEIIFTKIAESFIERAKKLENDLTRLDKRASVLDIRLDCQELERISIVNRLGKFHGRPNTDGSEASSISETALRKAFPQRYVTVLSVAPTNLPEGLSCLSL